MIAEHSVRQFVADMNSCQIKRICICSCCRAKKLYYVTTAGGDFFPEEYGFGYVRALAQNFYGIETVELIKAVGLDIEGAPVEEILRECEEEIERRFRK